VVLVGGGDSVTHKDHMHLHGLSLDPTETLSFEQARLVGRGEAPEFAGTFEFA
jgi:hypothetical protein